MNNQAPSVNQRRSLLGVLLVGVWSLPAPWTLALGASSASLDVTVSPRFNNAPLVLNQLAFTNASGESLSVTRLDLLLSDLALRRADGVWLERTNWQAFLSLAAGRSRFHVAGIPAGNFDQLRFSFIDTRYILERQVAMSVLVVDFRLALSKTSLAYRCGPGASKKKEQEQQR